MRTTAVTSSTISLKWDDVDCLEQNGPIQQYTISYGSTLTAVTDSTSGFTLTGLAADEIYSIRVAASNAAGEGPFSQPLIVPVPIAGNLSEIMLQL